MNSIIFMEDIFEKLARDTYYEYILLRHLPEIKAIEEGKIKGIEDEEIDKFFRELLEK